MHLQLSIQLRICAPGTQYWVARDNVDSKLAQDFYTWPTLPKSSPDPLDLRSNSLTARFRTPQYTIVNGWIADYPKSDSTDFICAAPGNSDGLQY